MRFIKIQKLTLLLLFIMPPSVFAGAAFDGLNAQIGVGFANLGSESSDDGPFQMGQKGALGNVAIGYSHAFKDRFNIAANLFYNFGSNKAGGWPDYYSENYKLKNIWGMSVEPGYYFTDSTLGYLKLGYATTTSELNDSVSGSTQYGRSSGALVGLGMKQLITNKIYMGAEAYKINFGSSSSILDGDGDLDSNKPNLTYGGLVLGYNFNDNGDHHLSYTNTSGTFNGINVQLGGGFASLSAENNWPTYEGRWNQSHNGFLGNIALGYSQNLNNQFNIAANLFYNFGTDNSGGNYGDEQLKTNNMWGISIEPGYYFTNTTLGYAKLGYASASSKFVDVRSDYNTDFGRTDGFLYGFGVKELITDHVYLGIEAYQINFSTSEMKNNIADYITSNKPAVTYGGLMVGYKF